MLVCCERHRSEELLFVRRFPIYIRVLFISPVVVAEQPMPAYRFVASILFRDGSKQHFRQGIIGFRSNPGFVAKHIFLGVEPHLWRR